MRIENVNSRSLSYGNRDRWWQHDQLSFISLCYEAFLLLRMILVNIRKNSWYDLHESILLRMIETEQRINLISNGTFFVHFFQQYILFLFSSLWNVTRQYINLNSLSIANSHKK